MATTVDLPARLAAATSADQVREIFFTAPGRVREVAPAVAEHARVLDDGLVLAVLASGFGVHHLLDNPALPENGTEQIALWALHRLQAERRGDDIDAASNLLERAFATGRLRPDGDAFRETVAFVTRKRRVQGQVRAANALVKHSDAPADALANALEIAAGQPFGEIMMAYALTHANAPAAALAQWAESVARWGWRHWSALELLCTSERARTHPAMRVALTGALMRLVTTPRMADLATDGLATLASDGLDDLLALTRALLATPDVLRPIEAHGPRVMAALTEEERVTLLEHPNRGVRLAAIAALAAARSASEADASTSPPSAQSVNARPRA